MYLEEFQRRERILFKSGEYDSFYVIISMARRVETRSRAVRRVLIDLINVCYDAMEILFVIRVISLDLSVNIINMSESCVLETEMKSKSWLNIYK